MQALKEEGLAIGFSGGPAAPPRSCLGWLAYPGGQRCLNP